MIWLGALGTLVLFILQVTGLIAISGWLILTPLMIGVALTVLFWVVILVIGILTS